MTYAFGLFVALTGFWFVLSGQTSPFFLGVAVIAIIATMWLSARLKVIDRDGSPYHRAPQLLLYLGWLIGEIVKANVAVIAPGARAASHAIDPAMVEVKSSGDVQPWPRVVRQLDHAHAGHGDRRRRRRNVEGACAGARERGCGKLRGDGQEIGAHG
jgi:hypothetical protein